MSQHFLLFTHFAIDIEPLPSLTDKPALFCHFPGTASNLIAHNKRYLGSIPPLKCGLHHQPDPFQIFVSGQIEHRRTGTRMPGCQQVCCQTKRKGTVA